MEPNTETHYCFVIHALEPYSYDFNYILALPKGLRYRHRYDRQWVDQPLQDAIEKLEGKEVLTLLCDDKSQTLFPVRWGTITRAQRIGRVFYFEYELGDLAAYHSESAVAVKELREFNQTFAEVHPQLVGGSEQTAFGISVFESHLGHRIGRANSDDLTNWGNLLDTLAQVHVFERVEFLKVLELRGRRGRLVQPANDEYILEPSSTYYLRLFQIIPNPGDGKVEPHDIEVNAFSDQIQILRHRQRAVGKYDVLTYVLKTLELVPGERTAIEVVPLPQATGAKVPPGGLYLPIRIAASRQSKFVGALRLAGVAASMVITFVPMVFGVESLLIVSIGIIGFVVSLVGWTPVAKMLGVFKDEGR